MHIFFSSPEKDDLRRRRYIQKHNAKLAAHPPQIEGDRLLVLVPHCLQWSECPYKITYKVDNCARCGKCPIAALLDLRATYGFSLHVATGGGFAREIIKKVMPRGVIALACERDLYSGIHDMRRFPVYGVLIGRPNGPCFDTQVEMENVESAVRLLLKSKKQPYPENKGGESR